MSKMSQLKVENISDLEAFIDGCTFFGVGGGGNPIEGFTVLKEALDEKGPIEWKDVDEINDNNMALCTFLMGSSAPMTEEKQIAMRSLGLTQRKYPQNLINAVLEWENYIGKKVNIVVPIEIGGSNMPFPMAVAKKLDKIIVDGDYAGRAIPEIFQTTLMLEDVPFTPGVSVDKFGNVCIIKEVVNISLAERLGKYLSAVVFGSTGLAGFPVSGKQLKRLLIRGTVTKTYKIGKIIKSARDKKTNLPEELKKFNGKLLFNGKVTKKEIIPDECYYKGSHTLAGINEFKGNQLKIFFKNENHIVWKNEKYLVSSPDLICCIKPTIFKPMRNAEIKIGTHLEVYAFPCPPILKEPKILKWLNPKYFGFDLEYIPI